MSKIFIVTGEYSGDLHASFVVKELKKLMPDIQIEAVGGSNLAAEGVKLFSDHRNMGVVGLDAIKSAVSHIKLGKRIVDHLKNDFKPDLVLLIDYGGFNLRLAKFLKKEGIKVFYYISPQVWATRKGRLNSIRKYISKMMVIFPFEEKLHKSAHINAEFVGHPLVSQIEKSFNHDDFIKHNNLDPTKKIVGIFPGSRKMEINYMLPIFLDAAKIINKHSKKIQFCLAQAPNISDKLINKYLEKYDSLNKLDIKIIKNQNHAVLACSNVLMLASGSVTLEASIYKTPMIVSYKGPYIAYLIYLFIRYIKFVSLPNIIAGKKVVEEFIQYRAKPRLIANEILALLYDKEKKEKMINDLTCIQDKLSDKIASKEVARIIYASITVNK